MYYNHNLRTNLQEWKNRLYRANYEQLPHQVKYFLSNIESNKQLMGIISEACKLYNYDEDRLKKISDAKDQGGDLSFKNDTDHAAYCLQFLKYLIKELGGYDLHQLVMYQGRDFEDTKNNLIEDLITPLIYYFHDKLEKANSTIYLLEKYKRRTEWFTKQYLLHKYQESTKSYEQIFEDDLRLFLFDQGIDYPFSTPKSASGRADIIGSIDTSDPIVLEIKIFDRQKNYGKNRIKEGFTQVLKYANDYNKDLGYLVIFNLDNAEVNLKFSEQNMIFPPMLTFNNKTFFFVVVNILIQESASKVGAIESIEISESELTS